MTERKMVVVICDLCTRIERPATQRITIDVCGRHTIRDMAIEGIGSRQKEEREEDEVNLLQLVVAHPNQGRGAYREAMGWDMQRATNTYNRLRKAGLIASKGKGQLAVWHPTSRGTKAVADAAV